MLTDTVHGYRLDAEMLSGVPGKALGGACPAAWDAYRLYQRSLCNTNAEHYFHFSPFLLKTKVLFGLLSVSKKGF